MAKTTEEFIYTGGSLGMKTVLYRLTWGSDMLRSTTTGTRLKAYLANDGWLRISFLAVKNKGTMGGSQQSIHCSSRENV